MKLTLFAFALLTSLTTTYGQLVLSGKITDTTGKPLIGASIEIKNTFTGIASNQNGEFQLTKLKKGNYQLQAKYIGYQTRTIEFSLHQDTTVTIQLHENAYLADEVLVQATRVVEKDPIAQTNLSKEEIKVRNYGQDMPYVLQHTPSVVVTSDAGTGIGYTGIRVRGSDPTRVNVTVNGIPLNDAESHGVFWVNMPDFASSTENIQIQRGIGSSTNGAGAFGASINLQTNTLKEEAYGVLDNSLGSYHTWKNSISFGSGLMRNQFTIDGRLSRITSDGYIDRSESDLKSFFLSGAYYGKSSILKLNVFSGHEITQQAWFGTPEAKLNNDANGIETVILNNGYTIEEATNIRNSDRRYNYYTYDNEIDNYQQDHYQMLYSNQLNKNWTLNAALHYTKGRGYFEQYQDKNNFLHQTSFASYGLSDAIIGGDTITNTSLVKQLWLDNDFYGLTYSINYTPMSKVQMTLGGGWNQYLGNHFGEIIWAEIANDTRHRYYDNNAIKTDFNIFQKSRIQLNTKLSVFSDLQYRRVDYAFLGFDESGNNVPQEDHLNFFNPKVGFNFYLNRVHGFYGFAGIGNKEPNRNDYTQSSATSRPKHETLIDYELGYQYNQSNLSIIANGYYMDYANQLVLTGQLNDVGAATRQNIDESYRTGIELQVGYKLSDQLHINVNGTISSNKIKNFTEYVDNFDSGIQEETSFNSTDISFSPNLIGGGQVSYYPIKNIEITWLGKYVGKQYLDNTSNENKTIDAYFVNDLRLGYTLKNKFFKEINIGLMINNVLNELYVSNGYTFSYISFGTKIEENYYYPQATTNFLLNLKISF